MLYEPGDNPTPFVISECTWSGLNPDARQFLLAARSWACPGPERLPGWRHNRPGVGGGVAQQEQQAACGETAEAAAAADKGKDAAAVEEVRHGGLVLVFRCAQWKAAVGITRSDYGGLNSLRAPADAGTRRALEALPLTLPRPRWDRENADVLAERGDASLLATQRDREKLALLERQLRRQRSAEEAAAEADTALHAARREEVRGAAGKRRADRLLRLAEVRRREKEVEAELSELRRMREEALRARAAEAEAAAAEARRAEEEEEAAVEAGGEPGAVEQEVAAEAQQTGTPRGADEDEAGEDAVEAGGDEAGALAAGGAHAGGGAAEEEESPPSGAVSG